MRRLSKPWVRESSQPRRRSRSGIRLDLECLEERAVPSFTPALSSPLLPPADVANGATIDFVLSGDFNRDGKMDAAVGVTSSPGSVTTSRVLVYLGNGDSTFRDPSSTTILSSSGTSSAPGNSMSSAVVADFDGKNGPDIAVAASGIIAGEHHNGVIVLFNNGDGTFTLGSPMDAAGNTARPQLVTADFDGKNGPDLAVTTSLASSSGGASTVTVFLNQGNGSFTSSVPYATGFVISSETAMNPMTTGNFDGKNGPDIAVAGWDSNGGGFVSVLVNNGNGTFGTTITLTPLGVNNPTALVSGDFNGKSGPDLAAAGTGPSSGGGSGAAVSVLLNDGTGAFNAASGSPYAVGVSPASTTAVDLKVADFNGDSVPDLVTANNASSGPGSVSLLTGKGDGSFVAAQNTSRGTAQPSQLDVGDFNGDSAPDLLAGDPANRAANILLNGPAAEPGRLDGVTASAGAVRFVVRDDHAVYEHDASGWHPVGLNFILAISATVNGSGTPVLFATTQGHDLFLFDPTKGLTNTGLRFIKQLSATTDAAGNAVVFAITDAHDLFEYGPTIGLVNTHLRFLNQISATTDNAHNPLVYALTDAHDLFSFGPALGLVNLNSHFITAISATHDATTGQAAVYALTQGHDLAFNDGLWHNLNSRFIQAISAGNGPSGQAAINVITQANDVARFDNQRGWVILHPPKPLSELHGLDQDHLLGRGSDGSVQEYNGTGWVDLGVPGS